MKSVIEKYIDNLTIQDIYEFVRNNKYKIDINDCSVIYKYIKNYWLDIYNGNTSIFNELKKEVNPTTFLEIMNLYEKYKKWI